MFGLDAKVIRDPQYSGKEPLGVEDGLEEGDF